MEDYNKLFAINPEFQETVVGFNKSGKPLGTRKDLDKLALMAYHNKGLAKYFVNLPTKEQIAEYQAQEFNKKNPAAPAEPVTKVTPAAPAKEVTPTPSSVNTNTEEVK